MHRYYCTYFDQNYLVKGLTMIRSLTFRSAAPVTVFVICFDQLTADFLTQLRDPSIIPISIEEIERDDPLLVACKSNRSKVEYLWTTTPTIILRVLERNPAIDILTYLDADLFFFNSPQPIFQELGTGNALIHEHRFPPRHAHLIKNGRFNVGLMCFRNNAVGLEILRWWRERCIEWCYLEPKDGKMGDQGYLNDWPEKFPGIVSSAHIGVGTAPWNQEQYQFSRGTDNTPRVNDLPLIVFHFHSFMFLHPVVVLPHDPGYHTNRAIIELAVLPYLKELLLSFAQVQSVLPDFSSGLVRKDFSILPTQVVIAAKLVKDTLAKLGLPQKCLELDSEWTCFYPETFNLEKPSGTNPRKAAPRRCLFVNTYYDAFLEQTYRRDPSLAFKSYEAQLRELTESCFGDSDFYSEGLRAAGWDADNIIVNCKPLQDAWASKYAPQLRGQHLDEVLLAQVHHYQPDVVYCQDMHHMRPELLQAIRASTKLIVGQIASTAINLPLTQYDLIISSLFQFTAWFRALGIRSLYQPLAFDERVLSRVPQFAYAQRPIQCSFVGSVASSNHAGRTAFLETVANSTPIEFWGIGADRLPPESSILRRYRGEAWGLDMFKTLAASKMTVNYHADVRGCGGPMVSGPEENLTATRANNMRLYEATGCGALLLTEHRENLKDLFDLGREIVTFKSTDECIDLICYFLSNPAEAEAIAATGQRRTRSSHSYLARMVRTAEVLEGLLAGKEVTLDAPDAVAVTL